MSELATSSYQDLSGGLDVARDPEKLAQRDRPLPSPDCLNVLAVGGSVGSRGGWARWLVMGEGLRTYTVTHISALVLGDLLLLGEDEDTAASATPVASFPPLPSQAQPPAASSLRILEPVHGATCQSRELALRWSEVAQAAGYRVMIHTSRNLPTAINGPVDPAQLTWWSNLARSQRHVTVPADKLAAATTYYLWVQALINGRLVNAVNAPVKFTTALVAPTNLTSGTVTSLTPTLTWTSPSAAAWVVQIRTGSATTAAEFAALPVLHTSGVLTAATYTVPGSLLAANTTYSYTVTARDVAVGVPGCEVASLPAAVTTVVDGASLSLRLVLSAEAESTKFPPVPVTLAWHSGTGWLGYGSNNFDGWQGSWNYQTTSTPAYAASFAVQIHKEGGNYVIALYRTVQSSTNNARQSGGFEVVTDPANWVATLDTAATLTATGYTP